MRLLQSHAGCSDSLAAAGYLPGMMIPHTRFFGAMSLAYLALAAVWGGLYIWHWAEVFTLQHCISAVIALSLMEMSTWRAPFPNPT